MISPEDFLSRIRSLTVDRPVSYRRLATNSLFVFVDCQPGDEKGVIFWLEPTWNLCGPDRVLTGSRQAQEDPDLPEGFTAACRAVDVLLGRTIEAVQIEPVTHSLIIKFSGGHQVRTFVSDPTEDMDWQISDGSTTAKLRGSSQGLHLI